MIMLASSILPSPPLLHIPDGFLSVTVSVICWALTVTILGLSLWRSGKTLGGRQVPLMGVLAAFIFAAQMLNFTVLGGTSGHLIGGALAAILLGPWAAVVTMTTVVSIQALIFQDGGLLAMGANILNMSIIAPLVAYGVYRGATVLAGKRRWGLFVGGFAGAWLSVVVSAVATAVQLAFSGTSPLGLALPAMAGVHALIGIGEGLITVGALAFVAAARRDLLQQEATPAKGLGWAAIGLAIALAVTLLAPLASENPDGLERVAEDLGFIARAQDSPYEIVPDYALPGIAEGSPMATILAGVAGALIVAAIGLAVAFLVARLRRPAVLQESTE
jgi:cobalt/nickel transport system permease protein